MNTNKIGARTLTTAEARLILPAYDQVYTQIERFRAEKELYSEALSQKTNNIGIIGVRGAGKTSILKTIKEKLEKENIERLEKDIILPIIVPENMSEPGTLMAAILGMLNDVINKYMTRKGEKQWCINKGELREKCEDVIRQYTYIQKEYRNILLKDYTTENDYVNRSAKVFNSDNEFIEKFNDLVNVLVNPEQSKKSESLLFLFIDDIDLSTYRCADVVKTLLSYVSNQNIVTIISGDLNTFEEALTLDFIRRENVLEGDFLQSQIGEQTLLESKKQLAYEYLKKILPPAYRYNIKQWSLEGKKNYYIAESPENQGEGIRFSDLLGKALNGWIDPFYFVYQDESGDDQVLPYTYHLFDDTSRGLNNVYNVLNDIIAKRDTNSKSEEDPKREYLEERKLLLDTIIAAKKVYNQYRDDIQKKMFVVGDSCENSMVFFDNASTIIYRENASELGEKYIIKDPVERFALFILSDFAARLLYGNSKYAKITKTDENYTRLKHKAMQDLFFNPEIAEKVIDVSTKSWKNIKGQDLKIVNYDGNILYSLNKIFLLNGDLVLNLAYYKNLPLDKILRLDNDGSNYTIQLERDVIIAFWRALSIIGENDITSRAADLYAEFRPVFSYIQKRLSSSVAQNVIMELFDQETQDAVWREKSNTLDNIEEKQHMKRILQNTIAQLLREQKEDKIRQEWVMLTEKNFSEEEEEYSPKITDAKARIAVLKEIDTRGLWNAEVVEGVVIDYIRGEIDNFLVVISNGLKENVNDIFENKKEWKLQSQNVVDSWKAFNGAYDGVSKTKAKEAKENINAALWNDTFENGITFESYYEICQTLQKLAGNTRVRYGRYEAQKMLNAMQEVFAFTDQEGAWTKQCPYFIFLLQCLYKYKTASVTVNNMVEGAKLLAEINKILVAANERADKNAINNFIAALNENLVEKVDADYFETLFS
jgi:hypothetical protein